MTRRSRRDTVVDDDHCFLCQRDRVATFSVEHGATSDFGELAFSRPVELLVAHSRQALHGRIEDAHAVFGDGADREFTLQRSANLAGDDDVEGQPERFGDLECDDDTAAGQAGDDRVRVAERPERPRQAASGVDTVEKTQRLAAVSRTETHVRSGSGVGHGSFAFRIHATNCFVKP